MTQISDPVPEVQRPARAGGAWRRWRPLFSRMHFYAGVLIGPFLVIAALTGLLYTLTPQLDDWVYRHELTVADSHGLQQLSLRKQIAAARKAHPEGILSTIRPPATATDTTRVVLSVDELPSGYSRTIFVDPYTGAVRGALTTYGEWLPIRSWFDELHRNLHLGAFGRNYSELAAAWLWVVALGGLAMWIGQHRRRPQLLVWPKRGIRGRAGTRSWHGALGVWLLLGLLGLSVTGLTWSKNAGAHIEQLRAQLHWATPDVVSTSSNGADPPSRQRFDATGPEVDRVFGAAQQAGLAGPLWIKPSFAPGQAWTVSERKRVVPTRFDSIAVDPETGTVVHRLNFAEWPWVAKLTKWAIDAHMGVLFGVVNQVLLALLAIGMLVSIVLGYRMWWQRRPTKAEAWQPGPVPARGALRGLKPAEAVIAVLLLAVLGWFAPLFGLSLGAFVFVDHVAGLWQVRRRLAEVETG